MKYRNLGGTDIAVSEVGFGVWTVSTGWWGEVVDDRSIRLMRQAHERGINYFDTADTYGSIGVVIILLLYLYISSLTILFGATLNAILVRMKEEISGEQILDAKPANEKPEILDDESLDEVQGEDRPG